MNVFHLVRQSRIRKSDTRMVWVTSFFMNFFVEFIFFLLFLSRPLFHESLSRILYFSGCSYPDSFFTNFFLEFMFFPLFLSRQIVSRISFSNSIFFRLFLSRQLFHESLSRILYFSGFSYLDGFFKNFFLQFYIFPVFPF